MASDQEPTDLNLTPYLDILMNLIVFVLVSGAGLLTWGVVPVQASSPGPGSGVDQVVPRVHLERSRMTLSLSGEEPARVTLDELPARLSGLSGRKLVLDAQSDVTLDQVVAAMDAARKAHFDEVTLAD